MLLLAFLRWETSIAEIPGSLSEQLAFLRAFPGGLIPIIVYSLVGVIFLLLAIGPTRLAESYSKLSAFRTQATPQVRKARAVSTQGEAVGEGGMPPQQLQGETDEEFLRRGCRELAQELYGFLNEQGYSKFEDLNDPKVIARDDRALALFREHLRPAARNLLKKLKAQGLYPPEDLASHRQSSVEKMLSLWSIEQLANVLNEIGHDW